MTAIDSRSDRRFPFMFPVLFSVNRPSMKCREMNPGNVLQDGCQETAWVAAPDDDDSFESAHLAAFTNPPSQRLLSAQLITTVINHRLDFSIRIFLALLEVASPAQNLKIALIIATATLGDRNDMVYLKEKKVTESWDKSIKVPFGYSANLACVMVAFHDMLLHGLRHTSAPRRLALGFLRLSDFIRQTGVSSATATRRREKQHPDKNGNPQCNAQKDDDGFGIHRLHLQPPIGPGLQ